MNAPERQPREVPKVVVPRIPKWLNPVNPESMKETALSKTAIVKEANTLVRQAAFRMKIIGNGIDDKPIVEAADRFLRAKFIK